MGERNVSGGVSIGMKLIGGYHSSENIFGGLGLDKDYYPNQDNFNFKETARPLLLLGYQSCLSQKWPEIFRLATNGRAESNYFIAIITSNLKHAPEKQSVRIYDAEYGFFSFIRKPGKALNFLRFILL